MNFDEIRGSGYFLSEGQRYFIAPMVAGPRRAWQAWRRQVPQSLDLGTFSTWELAVDACERDASLEAA